jgi:hypothetical protein
MDLYQPKIFVNVQFYHITAATLVRLNNDLACEDGKRLSPHGTPVWHKTGHLVMLDAWQES